MHLCEPHLRDVQLPVNEVTASSACGGSYSFNFKRPSKDVLTARPECPRA